MEKLLERRFIPAEDIHIETREDGTPTRITGYAAVFNSLSHDLGGFTEVIRPGTFARSIREGADIVANVNHNDEQPLGRVSKGTLTLREDRRGLHFSVAIPSTGYARDAVENIRNGNLIGCSFAFFTPEGGDDWRDEADRVIRELRDVDLHDVSPVTRPAYGATEVSLRSLEKAQQLRPNTRDDAPADDTEAVEPEQDRAVPPISTILRRQYEAEITL